MEYGVNLNVNAKSILDNCLNFKDREFKELKKGQRTYGKKVYYTDYTLKGYDKKYEAKTNQQQEHGVHSFRIEAEVKYMRHLNKRSYPVGIEVVKDLFDINKMRNLRDDLISKAENINMTKIPIHSYTGLKTKELELIALMQNKILMDIVKKNDPRTFARRKRKYKKLIQELGETADMDLPSLIAGKWEKLEGSFSSLYYT